MWFAGDIAGGAGRMEEAFGALADDEPGPELAELAEALGRVRVFLGDFGAAKERVERALEIAEALALPATLAQALNTKGLILSHAGRYEECLALLRHAIELGRAHDLSEPLDRALHNLSHQLNSRDRFAEAIELQVELLERARRQGNLVQEQRTLGHQAYSRWMLGEWNEVEEIVAKLTLSDTHVSVERMRFASFLALGRGDVAGARAALDAGAELGRSGEVQLRLGYAGVEAEVLRAEGRPLDALAVAREAIAEFPEALHQFYKAAWSSACEAALGLGDADQAGELLDVFERLVPSERSPFLVSQARRFRGRLAAQGGEREHAAELLADAADGFRRLQTPYYLAIALAEQAELGVDEPASLRAEAGEIFERLGARQWLERLAAAERAVTV